MAHALIGALTTLIFLDYGIILFPTSTPTVSQVGDTENKINL